MQKVINLNILFVSTLACLMISGCATRQRPDDVDKQYPGLKAQEFSGEIARLEADLTKTTDASSKGKLCLRLALLHVSPDNPYPDYMAALKELDLYASLDPAGGRRDEIRGLQAVLRVMKKNVDENKSIKIKMEQLVQENREIKKALEQLKSLDLDMEKRRKEIK